MNQKKIPNLPPEPRGPRERLVVLIRDVLVALRVAVPLLQKGRLGVIWRFCAVSEAGIHSGTSFEDEAFSTPGKERTKNATSKLRALAAFATCTLRD